MTEFTTMPDEIHVRMPSRLELLGLLDCIATSLCQRLEFDEDTCSLVAMSVIEAGTNAIQHGHQRDAAKSVDVDFRLFPDRIEIAVRDTGPGFDPDAINGDATAPEQLLEPRGRGIFIMRSVMDSVDFEVSSAGTICHLVKHRPPPVEAS